MDKKQAREKWMRLRDEFKDARNKYIDKFHELRQHEQDMGVATNNKVTADYDAVMSYTKSNANAILRTEETTRLQAEAAIEAERQLRAWIKKLSEMPRNEDLWSKVQCEVSQGVFARDYEVRRTYIKMLCKLEGVPAAIEERIINCQSLHRKLGGERESFQKKKQRKIERVGNVINKMEIKGNDSV